METNKNSHNHRSHPYRQNPNNGRHNHRNNFKSNYKRHEFESESSGKLFIHPSSMYDESFPKFQQPIEIGILLSESN